MSMADSQCVLPNEVAAEFGLTQYACSRLIQLLGYFGWNVTRELIHSLVTNWERIDELNQDAVCLNDCSLIIAITECRH